MRYILLSAALLLSACPPAENPNTEGCEHITAGPARAVTAVATGDGPMIDDDHYRYDVTLVPVTGGNGGRIRFAASEAGHYLFFLDKGVPFSVEDSSGGAVAIEESLTSIAECTEVRARHAVPLPVGTSHAIFGPTSETTVRVVVEPEAAH
jgi:hypothetical protein